ncbi:hypothetical protein AB4Z22_28230, partial [Paenibacillus sp. TAF58]
RSVENERGEHTGIWNVERRLRLLYGEAASIQYDSRSVENERGEHTGIWNVERRLRLLYGEAASIQYDNDKDTNGATIEIIIPTNPGTEETR